MVRIGDAIAIALIMVAIVVVIMVVTSFVAKAFALPYNFVYCFNTVTNSTFTYPEGVDCDVNELVDDNDKEEQEELEDEQEHGEWARDNES